MAVDYETLAWPDIAAAASRNAGVIVPVGAIEQHGPHLPVLTDILLARTVAFAAAEGRDYLIAPRMPFGYRSRPLSGGGPERIGTISLSAGALVAILQEVLEELLRQEFRRLVMYAWHMENKNFLYEAAYLAARSCSAAKFVVIEDPFAELSPETMEALFAGDFPGWAAEHAGIMETSVMLHCHAEHVRRDAIVDDQLPRMPAYEIVPTPADMTTPTGVYFKATRADAEKGRQVFREVVAHVRSILDTEFPELVGADAAH
jgi:creatinine amidohydrolase